MKNSVISQEDTRLALLPEIIQRLLSVCQPLKIILFGSYARGDEGPDSDIDLLVILDGVESTRKESVRLRRALRGLLTPVDIIVASPDQLDRYRNSVGLIYRPALEEGKVVYERTISF